MIAKKTKILALAVVGMMCAVAIVGAAYAAFAGEARTYNEGNNVDTGYMTLSPNGTANTAAKWAAISAAGKEVFSTYSYVAVSNNTYTDKTAYYFKEGGALGTGVAATYFVKQIGTAKTFDIDNQSGETITKINFKATAVGTVPSGDFKYFLKVTIGSADVYLEVSTTEQETGAQTIAFTGTAASVSVAICVGYVPNVTIPSPPVGTATSGDNNNARESSAAPVDLSNITFAFAVADATS